MAEEYSSCPAECEYCNGCDTCNASPHKYLPECPICEMCLDAHGV